MQRSAFHVVLAVFSLALACGGSDSEADIAHYTDQLGRMCTVDRNDISLTADCDADPPNTCAAGLAAAFTISADTDGKLRNCAACVDAAKHQTFVDGMNCSFVTCTVDADCVQQDRYTCTAGACLKK